MAGPDPTAADAARPMPVERASVPILRGVQVVLRPVTNTDVPALEAILREPEVLRWWMRDTWERVDEEGSTIFAIIVDSAVVGCIEYAEETDPDYRHAGIDLFVAPPRARDAASGRTLCAPSSPASSTTSAITASSSTRRSRTGAPSTCTRGWASAASA